MLWLIIITGILLYVFIGIVLYRVTLSFLVARCGCGERFCYIDHEFDSFLFAAAWPVSYIVTVFAIAFHKAATNAGNWVVDKLSK